MNVLWASRRMSVVEKEGESARGEWYDWSTAAIMIWVDVSSAENCARSLSRSERIDGGSGRPEVVCEEKSETTEGDWMKCSIRIDGSSTKSVAQRVPATLW